MYINSEVYIRKKKFYYCTSLIYLYRFKKTYQEFRITKENKVFNSKQNFFSMILNLLENFDKKLIEEVYQKQFIE